MRMALCVARFYGDLAELRGLVPGRGEGALRARDEPVGELGVDAGDGEREPRPSHPGPAHERPVSRSWTRSSWTIFSSSASPWWCSVCPSRSRLARR